MGGTTLSRFITSDVIKNYLEKEGYILMTGWRILTKLFKYDSKKIQEEDLVNISRIRFAYRGEKEEERIIQLFSKLIEKNKEEIGDGSSYHRIYGTVTLWFIKIDDDILENYRDVSVFKRLMYDVINKELNKV